MSFAYMMMAATLFSLCIFVGLRIHASRHAVPQGSVLIVGSANAAPRVVTGGAPLVWPLVQTAEWMDLTEQTIVIRHEGRTGLLCRDHIRADIEATFTVRVCPQIDSILKVAATVGCARATDPAVLEARFAPKVSEALALITRRLELRELLAQRDSYRDDVLDVLGRDQNGYILEDLTIHRIDQTPLSQLDPRNIHDAQGIRLVTERAATEAVAAKAAELKRDQELLALQNEQDAIRRKLR